MKHKIIFPKDMNFKCVRRTERLWRSKNLMFAVYEIFRTACKLKSYQSFTQSYEIVFIKYSSRARRPTRPRMSVWSWMVGKAGYRSHTHFRRLSYVTVLTWLYRILKRCCYKHSSGQRTTLFHINIAIFWNPIQSHNNIIFKKRDNFL